MVRDSSPWQDLKASRVKIAARDVLLSKKIAFSLVAVPALWISYALLLLALTPLSAGTVLVMFLCCPFFSYLGVMAVEAGMVDIKDLRPAFLRLLPAFRQEMERLPAIRLQVRGWPDPPGRAVSGTRVSAPQPAPCARVRRHDPRSCSAMCA